ncbi:ribosome maturation factor RimP [Catenisphaera adipataccumulans]|jgi:ribosome maturation factor RimP|uniref:Ribosome maturation factor RimP n=1 Tax=Catenisphaera adipataccumulans TaxID=700500 RepID=A0A7W8FV51_9FIRM|nr:ribosome maturation factor RimP [Catenisphaera adipataccumulans]MBB5183264.1 ribosome maturation factor RimP [Catenisphaera adipataccumulans]
MDELKQKIREILASKNCRLYELEWLTNQKPPVLRVSVDKDGGVDLDTCADCSEAISQMLDEEDWNDSEYNLEVCSPGAERELKTDEQIEQAIGSYIYVKLKDPKQGLDHVFGDLKAANDDTVTVAYRVKTRTKTIEIEKTNISVIMTAVRI